MKFLLLALLRQEDAQRPDPPPTPADVLLIGDEDLAAACVETAEEPPTAARLLAYARTVADLHRHRTVLPMRYGCVLDDREKVIELLRSRRESFRAALNALDGCVEMGVRRLSTAGDGPAPPPLAPTPAEARATPASGAAYLAARRASFAAKDARSQAAGTTFASLSQAFQGLFRECRAEQVAAGPLSGLALAFLVRRGAVAAFRAAFARLRERSSDQLVLTGPWPPYNFTDLQTSTDV